MIVTHTDGLIRTPEFTDALTRLHRGDNVFLTGKAGTGKSTLVREFLLTTERTAVVAAPTGIAALNVGGYTIHNLFSFRPETRLEEVRGGDYFPRRFASTLRGLGTLIIDEASMVRADLFDKLVAALERFGPRRGAPFGGVQLVLVGDLYQLPPVVEDGEQDFFTTRYKTPYFFSADSYTPDRFATMELTRVFRQVGDPQLLEILNAVRAGTLEQQLLEKLNTRTDADFRPPNDEFWLTLTTTNASADKRNQEQLAQLTQPVIRHRAIERGELEGFIRPTEEELVYKVGAQVMLLTNDPLGRWVNGTIGQISDHRIDAGETVVSVKLPSGVRVNVRPHTWQITQPVVEDGTLCNEIVGTFTQLPFRLSWAITIHKSQGQTLDRLVIDLTGGTFADGQLYVALSRCTSMAGLVLRRPVKPVDLKTDPRVRRFLAQGNQMPCSRGPVYLAVCTVGARALRVEPRPLEIALVTDDGFEITTLINPERDLDDARTVYDITAADVQLAPTLSVAWNALAPHLAGRAPIGFGLDDAFRCIEAELKRVGRSIAMPIGIDLNPAELSPADRDRLSAPRALDRARAVRDIATRHPIRIVNSGAFPAADSGTGYLLSWGNTPSCFQVGGVISTDKYHDEILAEHLRDAITRIRIDETARALLRELERRLGQQLLPTETTFDSHDIEAVLVPDARVCFTGTAIDDAGKKWARDDLEDLAVKFGLEPVGDVTKKNCDALIAAEAATQSGKGQKAIKFGKPIFTVQQFLTWAEPY
ncbi:AAA family ATPase [Nocardia beijingensis]|uniref:AAA family ATPase n=1 Tax=Nocardia beijingensis TaxID=95162 RepID=UPI0008349FB0|nr:AAA family ATPase [Nocardia beijingensis]